MTSCLWCEESLNILRLCENQDHNICSICYEEYLKNFPKRLKGCPYCNGIEETSVVTEPLISNTVDVTVSQSAGNRENTNECCETCVKCCCYCSCATIFCLIIKGTMASIFLLS